MATIGLIIAGGVGARMQQAIPKQFLTVYDKPIIAYTMEKFENHPEIDIIAVVCLDGWEHILESYAKQYKITKLKHIFPAGAVGQESIKNGIMGLAEHYDDDAIVLIHDAIRPNLSKDISRELKETYGTVFKLFDYTIPRAVKVAETTRLGESILSYDKNSKIAESYKNFAKELFFD